MKKIKKVINNNCRFVLGIVIGFTIVTSIAYAAITIQGSNVEYIDTRDLRASTVQEAIEKIYDISKLGNDSKFVEAYTYNQTSGASDYCVTGNESTCYRTTCYQKTNSDYCPRGTIIRYKVRPGEIVTFHVMADDGNTITMQSQKNTVYNTAWITALDYSGSTSYGNDKGPLTILTALESATAGWSNVNTQTYDVNWVPIDSSVYASGCSHYSSCGEFTYDMERTAKARMITVPEAVQVGCTTSSKSCPIWMYNYLKRSTSSGGTVNDTSHGPSTNNYGYWTMSAYSSYIVYAWRVTEEGNVHSYYNTDDVRSRNYGARAVVQVNKEDPTHYLYFTDSSQESYADYSVLDHTVFIKSKGTEASVCRLTNGRLYCFNNNNYDVESGRLDAGLDDALCQYKSLMPGGNSVMCGNSNFSCFANSKGYVSCSDLVTGDECKLNSDGSFVCT